MTKRKKKKRSILVLHVQSSRQSFSIREICGLPHSQFPAKYGDFALGLFLSQSPLDGVESVVCGQSDVPAADGGADRPCQDVRLRVETDAHSISVHHPQGAVVAQLIAVPHLVCRGRQMHTV